MSRVPFIAHRVRQRAICSLAALLSFAIAAIAQGEPPKPFEQRLSGTTATISLVPIPAGAVGTADKGGVTTPVAPFHMSATEITWDLYDLFVYRLDEPAEGKSDPAVDAITRPSKPYIPPDRGFGHNGYPAISMTAKGAKEFCAWLSAKTGRVYRLPTEAEWEHACRSGLAGDYGFEGGAAALAEHAWYKPNSGDKTHPVAKKQPSPWGLYDMHGNAAEWVIGAGGEPVVRGGSYLSPAEDVTAAARQHQTSDWNASDPQFPKSQWWLADCTFVGFRVVCEGEEIKRPRDEETKKVSDEETEK